MTKQEQIQLIDDLFANGEWAKDIRGYLKVLLYPAPLNDEIINYIEIKKEELYGSKAV